MSQRGIQTQKLPHSSVIVVAISSRWQLIGQNHHHAHGPSTGKSPRNEQSVSSTWTVAFGHALDDARPRIAPDDAAADAPEEQELRVDPPAQQLVELGDRPADELLGGNVGDLGQVVGLRATDRPLVGRHLVALRLGLRLRSRFRRWSFRAGGEGSWQVNLREATASIGRQGESTDQYQRRVSAACPPYREHVAGPSPVHDGRVTAPADRPRRATTRVEEVD